MREIPVYIFTGLLESGKTTLVHEVVAGEEDFLMPGKTVLLQCEEGETSYAKDFLEKYDIELISIGDVSELNEAFWDECARNYDPAQIIVEWNGMWNLEDLFDSGSPEEWFVGGIYSTVNGATLESYLQNMRKLLMEPLRESNLLIINRCDENIDRVKYRRTFKAMNPQVQVVFERPDGTLYDNDLDHMPFNYSGPKVEINDMDYGIWYLDAMDNPEHYMGKNVHFKARFCESSEEGLKCFVPGRHVMTCCEDDIEFMGFVCYYDGMMNFAHGEWIEIEAKFDYGPCDLYGPGENGPMLYLVSIKATEPPIPELVTFS